MPGKVCGALVEVDHISPGSFSQSVKGPVILLVKAADGDEEVKAAGPNVVAVVLQHELPHLSHLGVRARQEGVVFVTCDDEEKIADLRALRGQAIELEATADRVHLCAHNGELRSENELTGVSGIQGKLDSNKPGQASRISLKPVQGKLSKGSVVLEMANALTETAGAKAAYSGKLAALAEQASKVFSDQGVPAAFRVPEGKVIPFGAMEDAIASSGQLKQFQVLLERVETALVEDGELDKVCNDLRALVAAQRVPVSVLSSISRGFAVDARLIVRSSANVEDLAGMSGAGLYDSIANVKANEEEIFVQAVAEVWASLYTRRAVLSRRVAGVQQKDATMAILVQELVTPELSFVLHTVSPVDRNAKAVQAEIAVGLGETLASGTKGSPWRLQCNKFDGSVKTLAFANFSDELFVQRDGAADGKMGRRVVDYSKNRLSTDRDHRKHIGQRLATIGFFLEQKFGVAQDIEGCIVHDEMFIVQSRPQP
eukprot:TRINITY_DN355_c0_g1_i6.p1 TRINITY_DN355_c0_g1~~TRINITY_DN355_c0_g1_i6.p1  ORF type:complete len:485 (-),score=102.63 TRINITY_DN355_c0_g1_i6:285-1739(-)